MDRAVAFFGPEGRKSRRYNNGGGGTRMPAEDTSHAGAFPISFPGVYAIRVRAQGETHFSCGSNWRSWGFTARGWGTA